MCASRCGHAACVSFGAHVLVVERVVPIEELRHALRIKPKTHMTCDHTRGRHGWMAKGHEAMQCGRGHPKCHLRLRPKEAFGAMPVMIAYVMDVAHPHAHLLQQDLERILVRDVRRVEVLQNGMAASECPTLPSRSTAPPHGLLRVGRCRPGAMLPYTPIGRGLCS